VAPVLLLGPPLKKYFFEDTLSEAQVAESAFASPIKINARGAFLKVQNAQNLSPSKEKDFLAIAWFNVQDLPTPGQRMFLLSRYDAEAGNKSGYAVALARTADSLRPEVYWRDEKGKGGWYVFSDVKILPGFWFMLGLTYYQDRYLGTYLGNYQENGKIKLETAGGYDLGRSILPKGDFSLKVGSVKTGLFTGNLGPVGIFSKANMSLEIRDILKNFLKDPVAVPDFFNDEDILFWSPDAKTDLSPNNHDIKFVDPTKMEMGGR